MKVLLITTSFEDSQRSKYIQANSHYPLGLSYIKSVLDESWHEAEILFLNDFPYDECFKRVINYIEIEKPDMVGFNILTQNRVMSYALITFINANHPEIKIVAGGIHVSIMYEQILENVCENLICVLGEGEATIVELANGKPMNEIKGIAYKKDGKVVKTEQRELLDLNTLPLPRHDIFNIQNLRTLGALMTSRGCPFNCSFCVLDSVSRRRVRFRTPENVVDEIENMCQSLPRLDTVWIHDDCFTINNDRAIAICNEIEKRRIKKKFICSTRFKPFSKELLEALERAGFVQLLFGLESGSQKVLDMNNKRLRLEDATSTIKMLKDSNIIVTCFLIAGLHGENDETVEETINFVKSLQDIKPIYYEDIGVAAVYPGTKLYSLSKDAGIINDDYWLTPNDVPMFTVEHPVEKLFEYKEHILDNIAEGRKKK